jgi:hypothetical protein
MSYKALIVLIVALSVRCFATITITQHTANMANGTGGTVSCALASTGSAHNIIIGTAIEGPIRVVSAVASVTDSQGNPYLPATGSVAANSGGFYRSEIWHSLAATSGVTSVLVTFSNSNGIYYNETFRSCFAYEVSGTLTFDGAGKVDSGSCVTTCLGASVSTSTSVGFCVGIIELFAFDQNPLTGNEFGGGDAEYGMPWISASVSLISSTAAAHQPAWEGAYTWSKPFTSSTACFKQ